MKVIEVERTKPTLAEIMDLADRELIVLRKKTEEFLRCRR